MLFVPELFRMSSRIMSLVKRESFFDDDFFKDTWGDFDSAMQSVLDKFDNKGLQVNSTESRT